MDPMDIDIINYAEWYDQPGFRMEAENLEGLYTDLGAMTPAALLAAVSGSDDTKLVFVLLDGAGMIHALHRVRQYTRQLEQGARDAADLVPTAVLGETEDLGPTFVQVPADGFRRTEVRRVVALDEVNAMVVELPDGQLPVRNQNEARNVRTRLMMLVPPEAAGQLIASVSRPGGLTPRELWEDIAAPLFEDDERFDATLPFLEWCCVAYTGGVGADNPLQLPTPQRLELTPFLRQCRADLYRRDLPARFPALQRDAQNLAPNLAPMVEALGGYREDLREREIAFAAREEARALEWQAERAACEADRAAAAVVWPSKRWPNSWPVLTTLCGVATEAELPPLWLEMAKTNTKSDRATIQHQLDGLDDPRLGAAIGEGVEPVCTGELAKDLGQLRFKSGINNIDVGLSIFMVSHPDAEHNASVAAAAGLYDQQMLGVGNLTLPEVLKLKEAMEFRFPTSFIQVEHVCWCYQRLLAIVLGVEHPVVAAFGAFIERLAAMRLRLLADFEGNVSRSAGLLRSVQIKMFKWLDQTIRGKQPPLPTFVQITELMDEDQWTIPRMPPKFLTTTPRAAPKNGAAPAIEAAGEQRVVAPPEHLDRGRIPNIYNFKAAEYMAKHGRPPKNEKGREMCLRYHVKGECVKNCRRKPDHAKHSAGETDKRPLTDVKTTFSTSSSAPVRESQRERRSHQGVPAIRRPAGGWTAPSPTHHLEPDEALVRPADREPHSAVSPHVGAASSPRPDGLLPPKKASPLLSPNARRAMVNKRSVSWRSPLHSEGPTHPDAGNLPPGATPATTATTPAKRPRTTASAGPAKRPSPEAPPNHAVQTCTLPPFPSLHADTHPYLAHPSTPPEAQIGALKLQEDRLGKLVRNAASVLASGMSFRDLCSIHRGRSCLADVERLPHPAAQFLAQLRTAGALALQTTPPWSLADLDAAIDRGAHRSTLEHGDFLREEFSDMVEAGQWLVLPFSLVRHLQGLCLSPTGVVPQKDRRPRTIVDYSFSLVNQSTVLMAPDSLQFGFALLRILQRLHRADTRRGTIYLAKIDVADAFMRVWLAIPHLLSLGAILPRYPGEEPLVALPMILPMGWLSSPQYLCAVTETISDLTNDRLKREDLAYSPHRLDDLADSKSPLSGARLQEDTGMETIPPPKVLSTGPVQKPLNYVDVFMDDFILCTQLKGEERQAVRRTLFECIDSVIRPREPNDNRKRKEPNSVKKLEKGDGSWETRKVVLGWLIDTKRRTIELPPHRLDRFQELLMSFPPHQRRTSRRKWQQLIGELRSMVLAIPGGRGLFSQLQSVLDYTPTARPCDRLHLTQAVHDQLDDFRWLAQHLASRPTRWGEVVDSEAEFLGAVDASGCGMGGVWLHHTSKNAPLLWRQQFDQAIPARLVSSDNPTGDLTNSDLEQTGLVCQQDILTQVYDVRERTVHALTDNMAALSREHRGSTSVDAPAAYLCRLSAFHQRAYRYRLKVSHIPGPANAMADTLSRRWDLNDSQILDLFNSIRTAICDDARAVEEAMRAGVSRGRQATAAVYQAIWRRFCLQHQLDPHLSGITRPKQVAWLQLFAVRVRDGRSSASKNSVRSGTVADALNFVAQTFTVVGLDDPRFRPGTNHLDPRLAQQLKGYASLDPAPTRVKPIPLSILHRAAEIASSAGDDISLAARDMMWLAFFFLLRPGEYTQPAADSHPFRLCDVRLWCDDVLLSPLTSDADTLHRSNFLSLTFSMQKNGTRGESMGHGRSQNPLACPVQAVINRILYLRAFPISPSTPLCAVGPDLAPLSSAPITRLLRQACLADGNKQQFLPEHITAKSLRSTGAMALLNKRVDHTRIQIMGRWKSDAIFRYLHVQAQCLMTDFSNLMLQGGDFDLIPMDTTNPSLDPSSSAS